MSDHLRELGYANALLAYSSARVLSGQFYDAKTGPKALRWVARCPLARGWDHGDSPTAVLFSEEFREERLD